MVIRLLFDFEILPCEYTIYRKDRGSRGGGVLTAISESVSSVLVSSPADLEVIAVNLTCQMDLSPYAQSMSPLTQEMTITKVVILPRSCCIIC